MTHNGCIKLMLKWERFRLDETVAEGDLSIFQKFQLTFTRNWGDRRSFLTDDRRLSTDWRNTVTEILRVYCDFYTHESWSPSYFETRVWTTISKRSIHKRKWPAHNSSQESWSQNITKERRSSVVPQNTKNQREERTTHKLKKSERQIEYN